MQAAKKTAYAYNEVVQYECTDGNFQLIGETNRKCGDGGKWVTTLPTCQRSKCTALQAPVNGEVVVDGGTLEIKPGTEVRFTCDDGYEITQGPTSSRCCADGDNTAACTSAGTKGWSNPTPPVCSKVKCLGDWDVAGSPSSGIATLSDGGAVYKATVDYTCDPGFKFCDTCDGSQNECLSTGKWKHAAPSCEQIMCPDVTRSKTAPYGTTADSNSGVFAGGYKAGTNVSLSCDDDMMLVGDGMARCGYDGEWSAASVWPPTCAPRPCADLADPGNGIGKTPGRRGAVVGDSATYMCNVGYRLPDEDDDGGELEAECVPHPNATKTDATPGMWQPGPPACLPVECGTPPTKTGRVYMGYNGEGERRRRRRHQQHQQHHERRIRAADDDTDNDGDADDDDDDGKANAATTFGSTIEYACAAGYIGKVGTLICTEYGEWEDERGSRKKSECAATTTTTTTEATTEQGKPRRLCPTSSPLFITRLPCIRAIRFPDVLPHKLYVAACVWVSDKVKNTCNRVQTDNAMRNTCILWSRRHQARHHQARRHQARRHQPGWYQ